MYRFLSILAGVSLIWSAAAVEESNSVASTNGPARLVIIGASYACGWKQPDLPGYDVINKGVSGEQTRDVLARFDRDVLALQPSTVLIWGHINNIHRAEGGDYAAAQERAKADYRAMIERARNSGIRVILATEVTLSEAVGWSNRLAALVGRMRGKQGYSAHQ